MRSFCHGALAVAPFLRVHGGYPRKADRVRRRSRHSVGPAPTRSTLRVNSASGALDGLGKTLVEALEEDKPDSDVYCDIPLNKQGLEDDMGMCRVFNRYDPEVVRAEAEGKPLQFAVRAQKIARLLTTFFVRYQIDKNNGQMAQAERVKVQAVRLRSILTELGPAFVKLGQNLGNRPDLVPVEYMEELTLLQDRVPPFSNAVAMRIIEEDLGRSIDDVFSSLSTEPIAAASIGQVYRGTLRDGGIDVAVKVQRPGVRPIVILDLHLLRVIAEKYLDGYARRNIGCEATLLVDEFAEKMLEELDFVQEARNLEDFYRNFNSEPLVKIPKVYPEVSGKRVLVMEWINGVRCTDPAAFENDEAMQRFMRIGVESGLRQLLEFGLFHGDPHPGNVLAQPDGNIAYVDFGNVATISRSNQECLIDAVVHTMNNDYARLADDLCALGFISPGVDMEPIVWALQDAWGDTLSGASLKTFTFRKLTDEFNKLLYKYPIRVPERFSLVIRSLLTQEGICLTLQPDFNFLSTAFPYVARRMLTDTDPGLRMRLLRVVIVDGKFDWERLRSLIKMATEDTQPGEMGLLGQLDLSALVVDSTKLLLKDKTLQEELLAGFQSQPWHLHVRELFGFITLFASIGMQGWRLRISSWIKKLGKRLQNLMDNNDTPETSTNMPSTAVGA